MSKFRSILNDAAGPVRHTHKVNDKCLCIPTVSQICTAAPQYFTKHGQQNLSKKIAQEKICLAKYLLIGFQIIVHFPVAALLNLRAAAQKMAVNLAYCCMLQTLYFPLALCNLFVILRSIVPWICSVDVSEIPQMLWFDVSIFHKGFCGKTLFPESTK